MLICNGKQFLAYCGLSYQFFIVGILTVEGLHLTQATIQAATKANCITLKTKYDVVVSI
jgi:hypothetical protein